MTTAIMAEERKGPQRSCVACRSINNKDQLIRYVIDPGGRVLVDYRQKLPGRGAYTCFSLQCIAAAVKRKAFQRSFSGLAHPVDESSLVLDLSGMIEQKIVSLLGMARKSGQTVSGTNMVTDQLRKKGCALALVLVAKDISSAIGTKLENLAQRQNIECVHMFDKEKIGQILGKEEISALALASGALAEALLTELSRYRQLVREN